MLFFYTKNSICLTFTLISAYDASMAILKIPAGSNSRQNTIIADTGKRHRFKYFNPNPLHQWFLGRFFDTVTKNIKDIRKTRVLEFGCGEGFFLQQLHNRGIYFKDLLGIDLRGDAIAEAQKNFPQYRFSQIDLFSLNPEEHQFDLVIASEVIEHVLEPEKILRHLARLCRGYVLVTVPWEPWFCLANLLRGRDITHFGNHPEHVNHYNNKQLKNLLSLSLKIISLNKSFPFLIAIGAPYPTIM